MLPMIVSVCLSNGALAMSRKKVIVKRLNSIQNFWGMDVLCTDKTGTLTEDRVVLMRHCNVAGRESDDVLLDGYQPDADHQSVAVTKAMDLATFSDGTQIRGNSSNKAPVQLSDVSLAFAQGHAPACPAAADRIDGLVEVCLALPEDVSRLNTHREDVIGPCDHINDSFVDDRLGFAGILGLQS